MTGLIVTVIAVGIFVLSGMFLTKWEKAVFPGNQQNGTGNNEQKEDKKNG